MLVDDMTLIKPLGKGAFGEVYLTSKRGSSQKYATKRIDKKFTVNPKAKKYLDNEIAILRAIDHPNIVKLYEVKETSTCYYLVTEYCNGGGLSDCLEEYQNKYNKPFPEEIVQYLMKQIVDALSYLHGKTILHRDIKLDNILVNFDNEDDRRNKNMLKAKVKMIDFGFARYLKKEELAYSTLGSPINMDPGILRKLNKMAHSSEYGYDEKADIWSLGTICYEMLIGHCTFDADSMKDLVSKVEKGDYFIPTTLSKEAVSFLNGMLQYDIKKRLTAKQLSGHKFIRKDFNQLQKINLKDFKNKQNVKGSKLRINSKMNQSIWDVFGDGQCSVVLEDFDQENMVEEDSTNDSNDQDNDNVNFAQQINTQDNGKKITSNYKPPKIIDKPANQEKPLNQKALEKEFMRVFEMVNDDFIFIEPKLIPIIPGDDPNVIYRVSESREDF
jgi:serine/threonine protein kinase